MTPFSVAAVARANCAYAFDENIADRLQGTEDSARVARHGMDPSMSQRSSLRDLIFVK